MNKYFVYALLFVALLLFSCKITAEAFEIVHSYSQTEESKASLKDQNIIQTLFLKTTGIETVEEDEHYIFRGPYKLIASVSIQPHKVYGKCLNLSVDSAQIRIIYKDVEESKINDLHISEKEVNDKRALVAFKERILDIDWHNLEKVEYYVKFTGTYEDGTSRDYWFRSYAFPQYRNDRYNPHIAK